MHNSTIPLVSVIITTYNHGKYIEKSINSILRQTYENVEIIVIDDGSTDDTEEIINKYPTVIYKYQKNGGLSNARNSGIKLSNGKYVIFLDADDWLFPQGIAENIQYMMKDPELAFVSGSHFKVFVESNLLTLYSANVPNNNFIHFLQGNYIGVPAAVMYRRCILDVYQFDESIKSCQDFDIYLRIARMHRVFHHSGLIAGYRLHSHNMSSNSPLMLEEALDVLKSQLFGLNNEELTAYHKGRQGLIDFYTKLIYWEKLKKHKIKANLEEVKVLLKYNPNLFFRYLINYSFNYKLPFK